MRRYKDHLSSEEKDKIETNNTKNWSRRNKYIEKRVENGYLTLINPAFRCTGETNYFSS